MDYESTLIKTKASGKKYTPLRSSLLRWFMLLALVPLSLSSWLNYSQTIDRLTQAAVEELKEKGEANVRFITNWFNNRFMDLNSQAASHHIYELLTALQHHIDNETANNRFIKSEAWEHMVDIHQQEFSAFVTQHDYINDLYLINHSGDILFSVLRNKDLGENLFEGVLSNTRFANTVKTTLESGKKLFSDLEYYPYSGEQPVGFLSSQVISGNGEVVGVIAIQVELTQITAEIQSEDDEGRYIIGTDSYLRTPAKGMDSFTIMRRKVDTIQYMHSDLSSEEHHNSHIENEPGPHVIYPGLGGHPVIGVHQEINLPGASWLLISEVNREEALAPAKQQGQQQLLIFLLTASLVMVLAAYQARRITRPIIKLAEASKAVAEGKIDEQVDVNVNNEIGILADAFNYMNVVRLENELAIEQSSLEVQEALIDLEEQRFALDQHSIVAITDICGDITFVNDKFVEVSGYSRSELLGRNHRMLNSGHHDREFFTEMYESISSGKVWHGEICNRAKDGRLYWVDTTIIPFMDDFEDPESYIAIRTDITERKKIEEELIKAKEEAEIATQQKSEFLANMSHEIRTPMNGIIGMTGLLLNTRLDAKQHSFAEATMKSADALLTIINDILDFSKIEAGKLELEKVPFDLLALSEDVTELMAFKCRDKGIDMLLHYKPRTQRYLLGDPGRIRQILLNLLSNAIKFTEQGHILLEIESREERKDIIELRIAVQDSGIGIAEEKLDRIFNKFDQEDSSTTRKYGGTGLGLAICKQLCEKMGGKIKVESRKGEGATFSFTMKLAIDKQAAAVESGAGYQQLSGLKALIVDDCELSCSIIDEQLTMLGLKSVCATSGEAATNYLKQALVDKEPFDIVIADYQVSDTGIETLATDISFEGLMPGGAMIVVSSSLNKGEASILKGFGIDGHLTKPLHPSELPQLLSLIWRAKQQGEEIPLVTRYTLQDVSAGSDKKPLFDGTQILLVEDNPINIAVATEMLEGYRCKITPAGNGYEALAEVNSRDFDLIFMDCQMPEMDGFEATAKIRQYQVSKGSERTPIIAFTANAMKSDQERCLNAGMDDYISKPVTQESLERMLKKWLHHKMMMVTSNLDEMAGQGKPATVQEHCSDLLDEDLFGNLSKMFGDRFVVIIEQHTQNALENVNKVAAAIQQGELGELERAAHSLKGASGQFGAKALNRIALKMETLAKSGDLDQAAQLLSELKSAQQMTAEAMLEQIEEVETV